MNKKSIFIIVRNDLILIAVSLLMSLAQKNIKEVSESNNFKIRQMSISFTLLIRYRLQGLSCENQPLHEGSLEIALTILFNIF